MSLRPPSAQIVVSRDIEYRSWAAMLAIFSLCTSATVRSVNLSRRQYSVASLISTSLYALDVIGSSQGRGGALEQTMICKSREHPLVVTLRKFAEDVPR